MKNCDRFQTAALVLVAGALIVGLRTDHVTAQTKNIAKPGGTPIVVNTPPASTDLEALYQLQDHDAIWVAPPVNASAPGWPKNGWCQMPNQIAYDSQYLYWCFRVPEGQINAGALFTMRTQAECLGCPK